MRAITQDLAGCIWPVGLVFDICVLKSNFHMPVGVPFDTGIVSCMTEGGF